MRLLQKDDIVIILSLLRVEQQLPFVDPSHLQSLKHSPSNLKMYYNATQE